MTDEPRRDVIVDVDIQWVRDGHEDARLKLRSYNEGAAAALTFAIDQIVRKQLPPDPMKADA